MFKKMSKYVGVLTLLLFSFFYTDKAVDIVRRNDPVMKSIVDLEEYYNISAVNAEITDDTIIPGINGTAINKDESYKKLKKLNGVYESMLVFESIIPNISITNTYDKFVISGNKDNNLVSFIFRVDDVNNLEKIKNILNEKEISATFFIDGNLIENNMDLMDKIIDEGFEIENFGYNGEYENEFFDWTNNLIFSITNKNPKFCYSENKDYSILDLCSNNKMYTVIPSVVVNNQVFSTIKNNLDNGVIYSLNINSDTLKEIRTAISYVRQKGYNFTTLENIILEDICK